MGFDLGYYEKHSKEFIVEDTFADTGQFYNMIQILGVALPILRKNPLPDDEHLAKTAREVFRWFDQYVHQKRKKWLRTFADYCRATSELADYTLGQMAVPPHNPGHVDAMRADPDEYDPDLRAFFGRLILSEQPIEPELAACVVFFGRGLLGVLHTMAQHYQSIGDEYSLQATREGDHCFRKFIDFCEAKWRKGEAVQVSF